MHYKRTSITPALPCLSHPLKYLPGTDNPQPHPDLQSASLLSDLTLLFATAKRFPNPPSKFSCNVFAASGSTRTSVWLVPELLSGQAASHLLLPLTEVFPLLLYGLFQQGHIHPFHAGQYSCLYHETLTWEYKQKVSVGIKTDRAAWRQRERFPQAADGPSWANHHSRRACRRPDRPRASADVSSRPRSRLTRGRGFPLPHWLQNAGD